MFRATKERSGNVLSGSLPENSAVSAAESKAQERSLAPAAVMENGGDGRGDRRYEGRSVVQNGSVDGAVAKDAQVSGENRARSMGPVAACYGCWKCAIAIAALRDLRCFVSDVSAFVHFSCVSVFILHWNSAIEARACSAAHPGDKQSMQLQAHGPAAETVAFCVRRRRRLADIFRCAQQLYSMQQQQAGDAASDQVVAARRQK